MGEKGTTGAEASIRQAAETGVYRARITSDAGLLVLRELDEALGLTEKTPNYLRDSRGGRNVPHELAPLLRQSVYSRLTGYEDTNYAARLARDPAMQAVIGRRAVKNLGAVSP